MSRNPEQDMAKSHRSFTSTVKLCNDAFSGKKVNKYKKMLKDLETTFFKFDEDYAVYKRHTIKNQTKTEEAFNHVTDEEGVKTPDFPNNDTWADEQFALYVKTRDVLEAVLEAAPAEAAKECENEDIIKGVDINLVVEDIKASFNLTKTSIANLYTQIGDLMDQELTPNLVTSYEMLIQKLQKKVDVELKEKINLKLGLTAVPSDPEFTDDKLVPKYASFAEEQGTLLQTCMIL